MKVLKPWTIYIWQNGDVVEAASPVVTKDGIKEIYCQGWEIEPNTNQRNNEERHRVWRAKIKAKNMLNNTLNMLNWYGKKCLDWNGNVDTEKVRALETDTAMRAQRMKLTMEDLYKIQKFPKKEITVDEAVELGLTKKR